MAGHTILLHDGRGRQNRVGHAWSGDTVDRYDLIVQDDIGLPSHGLHQVVAALLLPGAALRDENGDAAAGGLVEAALTFAFPAGAARR